MPLAASAADLDLEKDLQERLHETRQVVKTMQEKREKGISVQGEQQHLREISEEVTAGHMLLTERFKARDEKVKKLGSTARERHESVRARYRKALEAYLALVKGLAEGAPSRGAIDDLERLLDDILPKRQNPILGTLPYRHLNYPAVAPVTTPVITPAYRGGNQAVVAADTDPSPEAPRSAEIVSLAQSLGWSPVAIYEYVKNNVETEWYWGCMKGAEDTLRQKSGNDCDQATLLVALLRASNYPARYVRGVVEFFPDVEKAKNLTGVSDASLLPGFFQKAGIPYTAGQNIRIEHLWVETYVPYSNYRGAVMDMQGQTWIALDTSIKAGGYQENTPLDLFENPAISGQLSALRDEYLSAVQPLTPLDFLKDRIAALSSQSADSYKLIRALNPEVMNILPSSLQFREIVATGEYTSIPSELMHTVTIAASHSPQPGTPNDLFSITLPAYSLSNRKVIITFEPDSVDDHETINLFGGLDNTPAYMVRLRPVLLLDEQRIVVGNSGVAMGDDLELTLTATSPSGAASFTNSMISGNMTAIGIVGQDSVLPTVLDRAVASNLLYQTALSYIDAWNKAEQELASLFHMAGLRPLASAVTVGSVMEVIWLLDQPQGMTWKGIYLDADFKSIEALSRIPDPGDRTLLFVQLSALQGSVLEHALLNEVYDVDAVSTARILQVARQLSPTGDQFFTIDSANSDTVVPMLGLQDNIKADISAAVAEGLVVRLPQADGSALTAVSYEDWSGIGYIKENIATGEAGYMLSGMIAGGMIALFPSQWPAGILASASKPYRDSYPHVMITSPQDGATISYAPIDVTGVLLDPGSTVIVNSVPAEVSGNTFIAYGVMLKPWENLIIVDATTPAGETWHASATVTLKIPLQAAITFPYDGADLTVSPVFIEGMVTDPTASVSVNGIKAAVLSDGRFIANNMPLSPGENPVLVTAMNRAGEKSTHTVTLNYTPTDPQPALSISIADPASNAAISNAAVTVTGTISTTAREMSVRVNNVPAEIYNNTFSANNVPLINGSNILIADALDANGAIARSQITITANTTIPHVTLSSSIQSGVAPLTTYFAIKTNIQNPITSCQLDFGDGSPAYTGSTFDSVSHEYAGEGVFRPVVTVTDSQGNVYTDTIAITMMNKAELDALLQSKWEGMKAALITDNIEESISQFLPESQDDFLEAFNALQGNIATIARGMQSIQMIYAKESVSKYRIRREQIINGEPRTVTYYIYFVKGKDGVWKIESF